jgi:hypothetical protein
MEESQQFRRRKSSLDAVLERNICFVDTPGFVRGSAEKDDMDRVVEYVESLLYQMSSVTTMEDSDVLGVIGGNGGVAIDLVLYLLPPSKSGSLTANSSGLMNSQTRTYQQTLYSCNASQL